jgi:tetratricopeptide (TPR) repeat protein
MQARPASSDSRRVAEWWPVPAVVASTLLAYANTWSVPFVYDDLLAIAENPSIRRLWPPGGVLLPNLAGGVTTSGRPVLNLSFALNYALSGSAVWSYHLVNALVHAATALALFGLLRRTLRRVAPLASAGGAPARTTTLAGAAALLWALHPLQTQAVTYTVQRAESLMGFFLVFTLYAFARSLGPPSERRAPGPAPARDASPPDSRRWRVAAVAACALGMATKEVMVVAPLLVLLYDRTFGAGTFRAAWRCRGGWHAALAATWLVLAALLLATGGNRGGTIGPGTGVPLWAYPLTQFEAIARYLGLSLWPQPLVFEYGTRWVRDAGDVLPFAAVVLPLVGLTGLALWRRPAAGFAGAWFFLLLAPTSLAPGTIQMIVEHRMYLPLAAIITPAVLTLHRVAGTRTLPICLTLAAACGLLTVRRNHDYRSPLALWSDTVAKRPLNPRAHQGRAEALAAAGRHDEALAAWRESLRLLPDESHYHYNLAVALAATGRREDAVRHYRLALRLFPHEARTHNNLAILLAQLGRPAEATFHYAEAVRLQPAVPLYRYNQAIARLRTGNLEEAAAGFAAVLNLDPAHSDSHFNLGAIRLRQQRTADALAHYETATRLRPDDPAFATALGNAQLLAGRPAPALATFEAVLARHADAADARLGAGNACAALRRPADAVTHFTTLLQRDPAHAHAHFKLGNALLDLDRLAEAASHYETARRLSPADAEIHHNLGIAFARTARWDEARQAFDEALRLRPDYPDARRSREQLRQVTGR